MKVLLCTNSFENVTNGPAKFANLVLDINKQNTEHEIHILTEDVSRPTEYVHSIKIRLPFFLKPASQFLRMYLYHRAAQKLHKKHTYEVLLYNNAFIGLWSAWFSNVPTVGMINDEKNIRANWSNFRINRWWFKQFLFKQLEKLSAKSHAAIITNSDFLRDRVINVYSLQKEKVYRLYKSIDFTNINFHPVRTFGNPIKVLFVKTDYRVGNLSVLIKALAQLPQYVFELTVIGPETRFETEIRGFVSQRDTISLNYLGPQPQSLVYQYLRNNDIFCVPSNTEAFGVANIEALAHGISVISSTVGGIPEVLNYGENGWLIDCNDIPALAAAIAECIQNKDLRQKKSEQGRVFAERFNKDAMLANLLKILNELCT